MTGEQMLGMLRQDPMDMVIVGLRLADSQDAAALTPTIVEQSPATKVLMPSGRSDDWSVGRAIKAGGHGDLLEGQRFEDLIAGLHALGSEPCTCVKHRAEMIHRVAHNASVATRL